MSPRLHAVTHLRSGGGWGRVGWVEGFSDPPYLMNLPMFDPRNCTQKTYCIFLSECAQTPGMWDERIPAGYFRQACSIGVPALEGDLDVGLCILVSSPVQ